MKRVFLPFDLPVFKDLNSNHPLPVSLTLPHYEGIEFVRAAADRDPQTDAAPVVLRQAAVFAEELRRTVGGPPLGDDALFEFITTRDFASQARFDTTADIAFCHTAPMLLNQMPYLLHIESITTLFHPLVVQGNNQETELYKEPVYWLMRAMLESERCRGIFTNLQHTKAQVDRVFGSEIISRKTRHVAAGPYFTPPEETKIAKGFAQRHYKKDVEILFTNSWHQHPPSFVMRGGLGLVLAFLHIEPKFPNVRLILRTAWPEELVSPDLTKAVREHPKITLLPNMLSEEEILDLFIRADIFFLDAESVHSVSLLRAMYCGAACIVSDVPGYEEYITQRESAIVAPGRREKIYSEDAESGWLRCNFSPMLNITGERLGLLAGILEGLCANRDGRLALGANARERVVRRNNFAGWRDGFEAALRDALAARD
jgi:glycosyltransferase involved in cell wall biosynthesis